MPQIETHVFGSKNGYETLSHSSGLSSVELAELDGLGFGQSSDPRVLAQLSTSPTALGRFLSSGRFAITRCVQGPPDDAGRATFRLLTIVLAANDYLSDVRHRLSSLLEDPTLWDFDRFGDQKSIRGRPGTQPTRDARSSAIAGQWAAATGSSRTACFVDESDGDLLVLRVASGLPEIAARQLNWGVRLFSAGTQATLFTTVPGVPLSASRKIVRVNVASGSPEFDAQRFGHGASVDTPSVRRSPMSLARNPLVLSAVATLAILIIGFWPKGSGQNAEQGLVRSSAGTKDRTLAPPQRTLSVDPPVGSTGQDASVDLDSNSKSDPDSSTGADLDSNSDSDPDSSTGADLDSNSDSDPDSSSGADLDSNSNSDPVPISESEQSGDSKSEQVTDVPAALSKNPCDEWNNILGEFKEIINGLTSALQKLADADFGGVRKNPDKTIECTNSDSLQPILEDLLKSVDELVNWSKMKKPESRNEGGKVVESTSGDQYETSQKYKVMVVLHFWKDAKPRELHQRFKDSKKKADKLTMEISNEAGEYGFEPTGVTVDIRDRMNDLFGDNHPLAFFKLLDGSQGGEGDLFSWRNTHPLKSYDELVELSNKNHVKHTRGRKPPNPGLLLEELPCGGD